MRHLLRAVIAAVVVVAAVKFGGCSIPTVKQLLTIGSPCSQSFECGSQPQFACNTQLPGGYCEKDCKSDADCPGPSVESICAFNGPVSGKCRLKCTGPANCRFVSGYICRPASNDPNSMASNGYCDLPANGVDGGASVDLGGGDDAAADGGK